MIKIQRILFPTDFSANAKFAQEYATQLAEHFGAELHVLYVVQDMVLVEADLGTIPLTPASNLDEARASAERALQQLPGIPASIGGKRVVRATRPGAPLVEIVRYGREHDIDMIVLGTHGRTGLSHVLLGSVAENVVRKATCPVLTIRPADHKFVMP